MENTEALLQELSSNISTLPRVTNDAISVGFAGATSIRPIKDLFEPLILKIVGEIKKESEAEEKRHKETKKSEAKRKDDLERQNKEINKQLQELVNDTKASKELLKEAQKTKDETDEKRKKSFEAKVFSFLKNLSKAGADYMKETALVSRAILDLEDSGVFLKGGIDSLGKSAAELGLTYNEMVSQLKKSSPLIAKMNAQMGDGLKIFTNTIKNIDDKYNLSRSDQISVFESVMDKIAPSQLKEMSEQQLAMEVDKAAKQMKLLSVATGKTVENLKQEQDIKNKQKRVQAYSRTHKESYKMLTSLGFDEDMIDYIASGGINTNAKILMQQMNSPAMQRMLPKIMQMANTNRLNVSSMGELINQNKAYIGAKTRYADRMSFDKGAYGAASVSDLFQASQFDNWFDESMSSFNPNAENFYNNRADNEAYLDAREATRLKNAWDTEYIRALSGGPGGIEFLANWQSTAYGTGAEALGAINDKNADLQKNMSKGGRMAMGAAAGTGAALLAALGPGAVRMAGDMAFKKGADLMWDTAKSFSETVKKMSNSVGGFVGGTTKFIAGAFAAKTVFDSGEMLFKLGKAAFDDKSTVAGEVDKITEHYGENGIWDYLNLAKGAVVAGGKAGDWVGDKAYALTKWFKGKDPNDMRNWTPEQIRAKQEQLGLIQANSTIKPNTNSVLIKEPSTLEDVESKTTKILEDTLLYNKKTCESIQQLIEKAVEGNKIQEMKITYDKTKGEHQN